MLINTPQMHSVIITTHISFKNVLLIFLLIKCYVSIKHVFLVIVGLSINDDIILKLKI